MNSGVIVLDKKDNEKIILTLDASSDILSECVIDVTTGECTAPRPASTRQRH